MSAANIASRPIAEIKAELETVKRALAPLLSRQEKLRREIADAESREFIRVNGITKASTQRSKGPDLPHFGTVWAFAEWLRKQGWKARPWAEWNGQIHRSSDLILGRFSATPARYDDLD